MQRRFRWPSRKSGNGGATHASNVPQEVRNLYGLDGARAAANNVRDVGAGEDLVDHHVLNKYMLRGC
jgi:hypothetical protein